MAWREKASRLPQWGIEMEFGLSLFSPTQTSCLPAARAPIFVQADGISYVVTANAGLDIRLDHDGDGEIDGTLTAAQIATLASAPVNFFPPSLTWREGHDGTKVGHVIEINPGAWAYLENNTAKTLIWQLRLQNGAAITDTTNVASYAITASEQGQVLELAVTADDDGEGGPVEARAIISVPLSAVWAAPTAYAGDGRVILISGNPPSAPYVRTGDGSATLASGV